MYLTREYKGIQVFDRDAAIAFLRETKGDKCAFPGCTHEWSTEPTSPWHMTLDHRTPQSKMKAARKPHSEIWDTDNLDLMHRVCNQRKGDVEYNDDGSLTIVEVVRTVKIARPDICETCNAGRAV